MNSNIWWVQALAWTVWFALMSLAFAWINRARLRPTRDTTVLRTTLPIVVLGFLSTALLGALAIYFVAEWIAEPAQSLKNLGGLAGIALFSMIFLIATLYWAVDRHTLVQDGIQIRKWNGERQTLLWSEIVHVRYREILCWFYLRDRFDRVGRISVYLTNLPLFARTALAAIPERYIDESTRKILQATAAGKPPSGWE